MLAIRPTLDTAVVSQVVPVYLKGDLKGKRNMTEKVHVRLRAALSRGDLDVELTQV